MDYETRHFVFVGPDGTIALTMRWTGEIPDTYFPVQMLNEVQQGIPQPYPNPVYKQREEIAHMNTDCWFVSLQEPQAFFQRRAISEGDFEEASVDPHCKWLNFATGRVELRPGHCYVGIGLHAGPAYRNMVELSHYAYGGKPIYYICQDCRLEEWEIAELLANGMLHPQIYRPQVRAVDGLRSQPFRIPQLQHTHSPRSLPTTREFLKISHTGNEYG